MCEIENSKNCHSIKAEICSFCEKVAPAEPTLTPVFKRIRAVTTFGLNPVLRKLPEMEMDMETDLNLLIENAEYIKSKQQRIWRISSFIINFFSTEGQQECLICYHKDGTRELHALPECPLVSNRCLRCMDESHKLVDCSIIFTTKDVHNICGLPYDNLANNAFHIGEKCNTSSCHRMIPYLMYLFQTERDCITQTAYPDFSTAQNFYIWLHQRENGITNGMELIFKIKNKD
jgi:hypothetical protein